MSERTQAGEQLPGVLNLICFACCVAGVTTLLSAADRHRWRTIGLSLGLLLLQSAFTYMALALEGFGWLAWLTVFTLYDPELHIAAVAEDPASWTRVFASDGGGWAGPGPLGANLLLLGLGLLAYVAALEVFRRRDLPAAV